MNRHKLGERRGKSMCINPVVGGNEVTTRDQRKSRCGWSRESRVSMVRGRLEEEGAGPNPAGPHKPPGKRFPCWRPWDTVVAYLASGAGVVGGETWLCLLCGEGLDGHRLVGDCKRMTC